MAISLKSLNRTGSVRPPFGFIYGKPGVGKSTLASFLPNVVFAATEDGLISPRLSAMPHWRINSRDDMRDMFRELGTQEHEFQNLVVDSADPALRLVEAGLLLDNNWKNLDAPGYGKGPLALVEDWDRELLQPMLWLRNHRNMGVWLIGHHRQSTVNPPDNPPYTQFAPSLPERISQRTVAAADIVAFATHPIITISNDSKFGQSQNRAVSDDRGPVLHVQERGSHVAKNRFDMPPTIPMTWQALSYFIPFYNPNAPIPAQTATVAAA